MKLSLVIPCYNESQNIPLILERLVQVVSSSNIEVLLVNNGSTDNSNKVLNDLTTNYPFIKVVNVEVNRGYGFGILSGLKEATGDVLSWTHADLQTDIKDVLIAFEKYKKQSSDKEIFVKGKRKKRRTPEAFFTFGMQIITYLVLGKYLDDINAQPKMFSKSFYNKFILNNNPPFDFSLDLFTLYYAKQTCKIVEIPVFFKRRQFGEAKGGGSFKTRIKLIKRTYTYIFEFRKSLKLRQGII